MNKQLEMRKTPPFKRMRMSNFEETKTIWIAGRYDRALGKGERGKNLPPNTVVDVIGPQGIIETVYMKGSRKGLPTKLKRIRAFYADRKTSVSFRVYAVDRVDLRMRKIAIAGAE